MKSQIFIASLLVACLSSFTTVAQVTKGLHFYMPFNEGQGEVAKDVGPNKFEAELHKSAKFTAKGKVGGAIEFKDGPALIKDPVLGKQDDLYVEHLIVAVWRFPFKISTPYFVVIPL